MFGLACFEASSPYHREAGRDAIGVICSADAAKIVGAAEVNVASHESL